MFRRLIPTLSRFFSSAFMTSTLPAPGQIVRLRTRTWLVDAVEAWKDIGKNGFDPPREFAAFLDEAKQREADMKHWESWLTNVDGDLEREPARIREFYTVQSHRIEPVGIVYLWPA